ncbi:MAG: hypothetical protein SH817_03865 [Leptospira sp.]|nr:hypothetical protein [Leptospira sp.]
MFKILFLIFLTFIVNCITLRKNDLAKYNSAVTVVNPVTKKLTYKLDFSSTALVNGNNTTPQPAFIAERQKQLNAVIDETGLFTASETGAEFNLHYHVIEDSKTNDGLGFLFGFTAGLIPFYIDADLTSELEIKNKSGKILGKIVRKESYSYWAQLFLILVTPFQRPISKIENIYRDQMRASFEEAISKKYFGNFNVNQQPIE